MKKKQFRVLDTVYGNVLAIRWTSLACDTRLGLGARGPRAGRSVACSPLANLKPPHRPNEPWMMKESNMTLEICKCFSFSVNDFQMLNINYNANALRNNEPNFHQRSRSLKEESFTRACAMLNLQTLLNRRFHNCAILFPQDQLQLYARKLLGTCDPAFSNVLSSVLPI